MVSNHNIAKNFAWKLAERVFARGIEFVVSIVIARILSPEEYGIVAIVLVFIVLADVFVTSGFSSSLIQKKDADETDFSTIFYCSFSLSLVIYGIIFALAPLIADYYGIEQLALVTRVFALRIPLSVYNSIQHAYVSRHMLFKRFFLSTLTGTVFSGVIGIYLAIKGWGVWALIAQYFVNTIGDTIILSITVPWHPKLLFSYKSGIRLMDYGWKILVSNLLGEFFGQLRNLLVGKYFSAASLAIYNRGQQIPSLIYNNIGTSITSVIFPAMANHSDDLNVVKSLISRSTRIMSFLLFPLFSVLIVVTKPLILLLLSEKWIDSVPFMQIMCLDYCVAIWSVGSLPAIKAIGKSSVVLKLEFIKKPIFLVLLIVGIYFGLLSVAITMVIYEIIGSSINLKSLSDHVGYSMKQAFADIVEPFVFSTTSGVFASLLIFIFEDPLSLVIFQTITFFCIYVFLACLRKNKELVYIYISINKYVKKDK